MSDLSEACFELRKVAEGEWLVLDHKYGAIDSRRTVGCVYEGDEYGVEVIWMRQLAAATRCMTFAEVLNEVQRPHGRSRATRPITIPHLPPLLAN